MDRRTWLRNAALIAAGAVAADQLDLLERLTWRRRFFPGADIGARWPFHWTHVEVLDIYGNVAGRAPFTRAPSQFGLAGELVQTPYVDKFVPYQYPHPLDRVVFRDGASGSSRQRRYRQYDFSGRRNERWILQTRAETVRRAGDDAGQPVTVVYITPVSK
jgi:hypothetical protein